MVNVLYKREYEPHKLMQYSLTASGHAGYTEPGKDDIVCASVSTLFYTLANYLEQIGAEELYADDSDEFRIECKAFPNDDTVSTAFDMAVYGLYLLSESYPDNVTVDEDNGD